MINMDAIKDNEWKLLTLIETSINFIAMLLSSNVQNGVLIYNINK